MIGPGSQAREKARSGTRARETAEERRRETERKKLHGWLEARRQEIEGTVAQQYLKARGLQLPPSDRSAFRRALRCQDRGHGRAAIPLGARPGIAAVDVCVSSRPCRITMAGRTSFTAARLWSPRFKRRDGKFGGLHQTWLKPDGAGKAEIVDAENGELLPAKKMRGQKAGCRVAIAAFGKPRRLFIAEGIETVLSVYTAMKCEGSVNRRRRVLGRPATWATSPAARLNTIDDPTLKTAGRKAAARP